MKRSLINPLKCRNCDNCQVIHQCPMNAAFREEGSEKPWVDFYRCSGCMRCKVFCQYGAIEEIYHPCDGKGKMGW